ncbi:MAG: YfhO family protein [Porcipelethomonas sp.]
MSHVTKMNVPSDVVKNGFSAKNVFSFIRQWAFRNKIYFLAFILPVAVMYIAYALFKIFPFGDECVLVLDLNGQYVYYFEGLRDAFWGDGSALYSWSRNLSGGYMGIIGYYLASPFTLIVMLLPRTMLLGSLLIMMLAKIGSAAVTFSYYLQKSKGLKPFHSVIFSTLYALMAYGVIQLMNPMWLDGLVFLPLIMLGVEYLIDDGRKLNYIIPLALMFIANFYIGFMIAIFTFLYFMFYLIFGSEKTSRLSFYDKCGRFGRFAGATAVVLLCSAFMLLPVYNALKLGKFDFSDPDYSYRAQFSPIDFFMQLFTGQYDSVNPEKSPLPEIYCGVLSVVLLPLFYFNKKISSLKKAGYSVFLFVMFLCMYIKPIDMMWHGGQEPNWLPFRYSFMFSFLVLSMAATAFANLDGIKLPAIGGSAACIIVFLLINETRGIGHITTKEIWISIGLVAVYGALLFAFTRFRSASGFVIPLAILAAGCGELLYNCYDTLRSEDKELAYSSRSSWYDCINNGRNAVDALENYDDGFYRAEKTFHRMVNDNLALGINGLSHSSSVMNAKILKFLEAVGYSTTTYYSRYDGNTPVTDSLLGIRYVMDKREASEEANKNKLVNSSYEYVGNYSFTGYDSNVSSVTDQIIDFYENKNALSIGYMADSNIQNIAFFGNDNPFNSQNLLLSTIAGDTVIDLEDSVNPFKQHTEYFKPLDVNPEEFVLNNVTTEPYGDQIKYVAAESGDPTVNMFITPETGDDVYMFFKTEYQHSVNLWLSTEQDANGDYINHKFVKSYFENHDYHIINLGSFEPGKTFNLRMTVANDFTIVKNFFFYQFDNEKYQAAMDKLKTQQWNLTDAGGRHLEGTIEAGENQIMMTSIPYEPGWKIKVDGKRVDNLINEVENEDGTTKLVNGEGETGQIIIADAFVGLRLTPGTHTVEMTYTPPGFIIGIFALIAGIVIIVYIYRYDKKNNKVLIAMRRAKAEQLQESGSRKLKAGEDSDAEKPDESGEIGSDAQEEKSGNENTVSAQKSKQGSGRKKGKKKK